MSWFRKLIIAVAISGLAGCAADAVDGSGPGASNGKADEGPVSDDDFPLSPIGEVKPEMPRNLSPTSYELPDGRSAPTYYIEPLLALQSPVQSQASRGVCSIFATVGLMEHLYIKAYREADANLTSVFGAESPDFSEQFLQWAVKFEQNSFPNSSGSSAYYNLAAIEQGGIVLEDVHAYQTSEWSGSSFFGEGHPASSCNGEDNAPTYCYSNGDLNDQSWAEWCESYEGSGSACPEAIVNGSRVKAKASEILAAKRYTLPRKEWVSSTVDSIKAIMLGGDESGESAGRAVIVGMDFFYQAWNHGGASRTPDHDNWQSCEGDSPVLTTSDERRKRGIVTYPNECDKEFSLAKRAGHAFVLLGWDDEMEVEQVDQSGQPTGEKIKGFFLFKNSWGTDRFGTEHGWEGRAGAENIPAGYGWISYEYVEEYANAYTSGLPEVESTAPVDETIEAELPDGGLAIPDGDSVSAKVEVPSDAIEGRRIQIEAEVSHDYGESLTVELFHGETSVKKWTFATGGAINQVLRLDAPYQVEDASGRYTLTLADADEEYQDNGLLKRFSVQLVR